LLGQIRERFTGGRSVRAIAVSAYAREEDRNRCLEAGFQAHIAKPFDPAELSRVLARVARSEGLLRSREAGGSRVPDLPAEARGPEVLRREEGAGLRVLVVEDDGDAREGLRLLLESWGFRVEEARDGVSAIASATARPPHVAIIDVGLPDMEGYELARRLRTVLGETRMVLIALTGYVGGEDRRRAFDSGFDAFLTKPVDVPKLRTLLNLEPPPPAPLARRGNFAPLE